MKMKPMHLLVPLVVLVLASCGNQESASPGPVAGPKKIDGAPQSVRNPVSKATQILPATDILAIESSLPPDKLENKLLEALNLFGLDCLAEVAAAVGRRAAQATGKGEADVYKILADAVATYWKSHCSAEPTPDFNGILNGLDTLVNYHNKGRLFRSTETAADCFLEAVVEESGTCEAVFKYYLTNPYPKLKAIPGGWGGVAAATAQRNGYLATLHLAQTAKDPAVEIRYSENIVHQWVFAEPEAASTWIKDTATGEVKSHAVRTMVNFLASEGDIGAALAWLPYGPPEKVWQDEMQLVIERAISKSRKKDASQGSLNP